MSPKPTKNMTDKLRLDDITRRTLLGVEEDLEDLRGDLTDELQYFEERLRTLSDGLPEWLEIDGRTIRDIFRFSEDSPLPDGILGPRTVALAAADVEAFILTWLKYDASDSSKNFALLDTRDEFTRAADDVGDFLDDVHQSSKILANDAHTALEDLIDVVLYELETKRRTDVNALDSLVQEGALDPGRDAQKETAEIWEEQRLYVDEINAAFDPLMDLVDEGLALTHRGILELLALVERATQGRLGISIESALLPNFSHAELDDKRAIKQENIEISVTSPTETAYSETDDFHATSHDTLPAQELIANIAASVDNQPEVQKSHIESSQTKNFQDDYAYDTFDIITDDDSFDGELAAATIAQAESLEYDFTHPQEDPVSFEEEDEADEVYSGDFGAHRMTAVEQLEREQNLDTPFQEHGEIRAKCFRVRSGWHPIPRKEWAAVLIPPSLFLIGIVFLCSLYLLGMLDESPLRIWGWTRGAITASIGWLVVLPILMNWYPAWNGWIPKFVRHYEDGENATALVDERRFSLERISCPLRDLKQVRVLRWESLRDRTRGWLLVIEPRYHAAVFLVTSEEDDILWFDSPLPRAEPPVDSWQLTPENFELLRERLEPSSKPPVSAEFGES